MPRDTKKQAGELDPIDFMEQGVGDSIPSNPSGLALMFAGIAIGAGVLYLLATKRATITSYARDLAARGRDRVRGTTEVLHH